MERQNVNECDKSIFRENKIHICEKRQVHVYMQVECLRKEAQAEGKWKLPDGGSREHSMSALSVYQQDNFGDKVDENGERTAKEQTSIVGCIHFLAILITCMSIL